MKKSLIVVLLLALAGCSYRMTSNIPTTSQDRTIEAYPVLITESDLDVEYDVLGPLEVSIRPGFLFGSKPTREHARLGMMQKARQMGATAVIKVTYEEGFDVISLGHIEAQGTAVIVK